MNKSKCLHSRPIRMIFVFIYLPRLLQQKCHNHNHHHYHHSFHCRHHPRGEIIRTVMCCVACTTVVHILISTHAYMSSSRGKCWFRLRFLCICSDCGRNLGSTASAFSDSAAFTGELQLKTYITSVLRGRQFHIPRLSPLLQLTGLHLCIYQTKSNAGLSR